MTGSASAFHAARELLLQHRDDYDRAYAEFRWPELDGFNWALDWFDAIGGDVTALWVVEEDGSEQKLSFAELSERSNRVANHLRGLGVARGDRLILMLGNQVELWETLLAAMKLGAVVIPATTLLGPTDLVEPVERPIEAVEVRPAELGIRPVVVVAVLKEQVAGGAEGGRRAGHACRHSNAGGRHLVQT